MEIIIQLIAGAIGGNAAGALLKPYSLGTLGNSVVGILGGGIGGRILAALGAGGIGGEAAAASGLDIGSIVSGFASGGVGGAVLLVIVGIIRSVLGRR